MKIPGTFGHVIDMFSEKEIAAVIEAINDSYIVPYKVTLDNVVNFSLKDCMRFVNMKATIMEVEEAEV